MEYIKIGKIVNTHGIKGELRIRSNFEYKDKIFKPGFVLYIGPGYVPEKIVTYRVHKEFDMVTFEGYDNINQVLNYLKLDVYINKDDLVLNDNEYILEELVGYKIIYNGEDYGTVEEIIYNNSNVLLAISYKNHYYIPNNANFIKKVNGMKKEIEVDNIEGLII